ncbi:hypothetical protein G4Y79_17235 [Phototrophicus methaneseepsis]|uniref:Uncharacterized protein n=1 Tax=Phototrophicus methaneseepsis TaxID=2710758 RepID=A0A7S8E6U0_9CHLR|nr:hypothetical protein [Phototrophicus methaneseepsis]QPC81429.1 hypothetical protein G4Y79_17235 [Phototrophicus methaneseepsis]
MNAIHHRDAIGMQSGDHPMASAPALNTTHRLMIIGAAQLIEVPAGRA